ncbi:hypothetical protein [Isoalcanivorax pacificus]|nr:hypothetical protein [Isoalcanivorax pacificus]
MSEHGYMMAWSTYLGAAVVTLAVLWWLTWRWSAAVKLPLRALAIAFLLTPWPVARDTDALGPAWVVTMFDTLVQSDADPLRAGAPLLAAILLALAVAGVIHYLRRTR